MRLVWTCVLLLGTVASAACSILFESQQSENSLVDCSAEALVACFLFEEIVEEGNGKFLVDGSGHENHAAIISGAELIPGKFGNALKGSTALETSISFANESLNSLEKLTIEAWIHTDQVVSSGRQGLFDYENNYGLFVTLENSLTCTVVVAAVATVASEITVPAGRWAHVACVYDNQSIQIYINGKPVASEPATGVIGTPNTAGATIGSNSPSGEQFIGKIDTLRIWETARTQVELETAAALGRR